MAKIEQVKAARNETKCEKCGASILVGSPYRHWKTGFRAPKSVRCMKDECTPKPSELQGSEFVRTVMQTEEMLHDACGAYVKDDALPVLVEALGTCADEIRTLGEETQEKFDNMPEGLQGSDNGQRMEERANGCEELAQAIEEKRDELGDKGEEAPETEEARQELVEDLLMNLDFGSLY